MPKEAAPEATGTATVTVACKLPNGLILRNFKMVDFSEPVMGGGTKNVKRAEQVGEPIRINGAALRVGQIANHAIVGGYGLTRGVPADFFERWMKANEQSDVVKNGLIFAHEDRSHVGDQAREQRAIKNGLEPLSIDSAGQLKDPRVPGRIKVADDNKAKPMVEVDD